MLQWENGNPITYTYLRNYRKLICLVIPAVWKAFRKANGCVAVNSVKGRPEFSLSQVVQTSHAAKVPTSAGHGLPQEALQCFSLNGCSHTVIPQISASRDQSSEPEACKEELGDSQGRSLNVLREGKSSVTIWNEVPFHCRQPMQIAAPCLLFKRLKLATLGLIPWY